MDLSSQSVFKKVDYTFSNIEWFGIEGERGLRGMAFDDETLYVTSGNRLLAYDRDFRQVGSWSNDYLVNCYGISAFGRELFIACSANDCILAFDLDEKKFHWAMHVRSEHFQFRPVPFDPTGSDGPIAVDKLKLRSIRCSEGGIYISGMQSGGLLHFNGSKIQMLAQIPDGARDIQVFRNGVIFNDSRSGLVRYAGDNDASEDRAMPVPYFLATDHRPNDDDERRVLKRGYARGLCVLSKAVVAGGSTPAGINLYDLPGNRQFLSVRFTKETREAVNDIIVYPG